MQVRYVVLELLSRKRSATKSLGGAARQGGGVDFERQLPPLGYSFREKIAGDEETRLGQFRLANRVCRRIVMARIHYCTQATGSCAGAPGARPCAAKNRKISSSPEANTGSIRCILSIDPRVRVGNGLQNQVCEKSVCGILRWGFPSPQPSAPRRVRTKGVLTALAKALATSRRWYESPIRMNPASYVPYW